MNTSSMPTDRIRKNDATAIDWNFMPNADVIPVVVNSVIRGMKQPNKDSHGLLRDGFCLKF